jgi:hypothetical protein
MNRRAFLGMSAVHLGALGVALTGVAPAFGSGKKGFIKLVDFSDSGERKGVLDEEKVRKTDAEWKAQLSPEA